MATRLGIRPKAKESSKARNGGSTARPPKRFTTLMGFTLEAEPMPDNPAETLYTVTHPDIPGMAVGDSEPWQALLYGLEGASHMLRHRMDDGEQLPMQSRPK